MKRDSQIESYSATTKLELRIHKSVDKRQPWGKELTQMWWDNDELLSTVKLKVGDLEEVLRVVDALNARFAT